jgi:hypothetical protein
MLQCSIIFRVACTIFGSSTPDIVSDGKMMESSMKNLFFAALAALTLSVAVVPAYASTVASDHTATLMQQSGSYVGGGN